MPCSCELLELRKVRGYASLAGDSSNNYPKTFKKVSNQRPNYIHIWFGRGNKTFPVKVSKLTHNFGV